MFKLPMLSSLILFVLTTQTMAQKTVIAHRGASAYLPEHTLEAKAMAHAMGADYIEQDVVMTADDHLIVLHDITLDRTTNVAVVFPDRSREDGRYYAIDFTLAEIRQLTATEGFRVMENGGKQQYYPERFPLDSSRFSVPTLSEEIELIQGLNHSTGKNVGIYPEIKQPAFHRNEGKDISTAVVRLLKHYGYRTLEDSVFLQTFDFAELRILHDEIFPAEGVEFRLVQLLRNHDDYPWIFERDGLLNLAAIAYGIGPDHTLVIDPASTQSNIIVTDLVRNAHAAELKVHPYTYRSDPGQVPNYARSFENLLELHLFSADADGLFSDFPDQVVMFLNSRQ
ncbi:MAG: glycerophosphodiester phosphodiesterase [Gammaproteobacteria bacterium]|nr:glycerophosphodiester phosphodiesterase [Gammaproteobacteria bacterium]